MTSSNIKPRYAENLSKRLSKLLDSREIGEFRDVKWLIDSLLLLAIFYKMSKPDLSALSSKTKPGISSLEDRVNNFLSKSNIIKVVIAMNSDLEVLVKFKSLSVSEKLILIDFVIPFLFRIKAALKPEGKREASTANENDIKKASKVDAQEIRAKNRKYSKSRQIVSATPYGKDGEELRNRSGKRWKDLEPGSDLPDFNEIPSAGRRFRN